jgi:hypothetical protein
VKWRETASGEGCDQQKADDELCMATDRLTARGGFDRNGIAIFAHGIAGSPLIASRGKLVDAQAKVDGARPVSSWMSRLCGARAFMGIRTKVYRQRSELLHGVQLTTKVNATLATRSCSSGTLALLHRSTQFDVKAAGQEAGRLSKGNGYL